MADRRSSEYMGCDSVGGEGIWIWVGKRVDKCCLGDLYKLTCLGNPSRHLQVCCLIIICAGLIKFGGYWDT